MKASASTLFALRSLGRNTRRTILEVAGVAVGVAICLFMASLMDGAMSQWYDMMAKSGYGHLRIAPADWERTRDDDLRLADWRAALALAGAAEGVEVAAPRSRAGALLAFGNRNVALQMAGVDPGVEQRACSLVRPANVTRGRYLRPGDRRKAVVGAAVAERLGAETGDLVLVSTSSVKGEVERDMFEVVGVVETGSFDIETTICHVSLEDVGELTGAPGAGEIALLLRRGDLADATRAALAPGLPDGDALLGLDEMLPGIGQMASSKKGYSFAIVSICVFVVMLGIVSSRITAFLERRREIGVLMALGMGPRSVVKLLMVEAAATGLAGALAGLALGMPGVWYMATRGLDFSAVYDMTQINVGGIQIDPVFYGDIGWWVLPVALVVGLASTALASLYPAYLSTRLQPAEVTRAAT
jgi:ABC-type lipoprotein release transport system permease subunit